MSDKRLFPSPIVAVLTGALGGGGGASAVWLVIRSFEQGQVFLDAPKALTWLFMIGVLCASCALGALVVWGGMSALRAHWAANRRNIVVTVVVLTVLVVLKTFVVVRARVVGHSFLGWSANPVVVLGELVGILAAIGILTVYYGARDLSAEAKADHATVEDYLDLRRHLHWFLWTLGGITGAGTLATGALRGAIIEAELVQESAFPVEYVLAYGAIFTCLVGLVYIPTYLRLTAAGERIREAFCPISTLQQESLHQWQSDRKDLDEMLYLKVSAAHSFATGMVILTPLLASAVPALLG